MMFIIGLFLIKCIQSQDWCWTLPDKTVTVKSR